MDKRQKIVWSEGMFLTPHHFQQWDRYHEMLLSEHLHAITPFGWGITELDIDPDGLSNGNVALLRFRGVLPDGLVVNLPDQEPSPETRPIGTLFPASLDSIGVFLGVPVERPGAANCRLDGQAPTRPMRYTAEPATSVDDNTGETLREVLIARKNLKIFFSGEEMGDYTTIKIAELVRTPAGAISLKETYIPAVLAVSASPALMKLARGLLEILSAKSNSLSGIRRGVTESAGIDMAKFLLLQTLNGFIPPISHFCQTGRIHPEALYRILAQLAGQLIAFSTAIQLKEIPPYDHNNLSRTFGALDQKIRSIVDVITPTQYVPIPLETKRENVLAGRVSDEKLFKSSQFFLVAAGDLPEDQLREMIPRRVKVGAVNELDLIVSAAMPGVRLYHTPRPPTSIPMKTGHHYFRLENYGDFWESICRSQVVGFYVPSDLKPLKFELLAAKES